MIRGAAASAHFVPAQGLRAHGISLSRLPDLCQQQSSPKRQTSYRSTMPLQVQSSWTSLALGICQYLIWARGRQHPHPCKHSFSNTSSMSLSVWTAGCHSHEERKEKVFAVHHKNPITLITLGDPMPIPVTLKGQNQKACPMWPQVKEALAK